MKLFNISLEIAHAENCFAYGIFKKYQFYE